MAEIIRDKLSNLKNPNYTGENRCWPCTAINVLIALISASALALYSTELAVIATILFLVIIYFHGFLIPRTPVLTERYLPAQVLNLFGKPPTTSSTIVTLDEQEAADFPERFLGRAEILVSSPGRNDRCLDTEFAEGWREQVQTARENEGAKQTQLTALAPPEVEGVSVEHHGTTSAPLLGVEEPVTTITATVDGRQIGMWGSETALLADIAAAAELRKTIPEWGQLDIKQRNRVLLSLRIFLERCPSCDASVELAQEDRCCGRASLIRAQCCECDALILEVKKQSETASLYFH